VGYIEAQRAATARYNKKTYDRIEIVVHKGKKQAIKEFAQKQGKSTNEPLPVKRTGKKYKVFTQSGRYAGLWQAKIWVICWADNPNLRFLSGSEVKRMLFHRSQDAEGSL